MVFVLMQFDQGTEYRPLIDGIMFTQVQVHTQYAMRNPIYYSTVPVNNVYGLTD